MDSNNIDLTSVKNI